MTDDTAIRLVFLGPPGVGKGTYATRIAEKFGFQHVAAGDLVRAEIKSGSPLGQSMKDIVASGNLLPDDMVLDLVKARIESRAGGFLLDGFPRTEEQAKALEQFAPVSLALNLSLREDVLVEKCMGRRLCSKCGKNWNVADIKRAAEGGQPAIDMPPLMPPAACMGYMQTRADDREDVIRKRLDIYRREAGPVENFYRQRGVLSDFEITGGIQATMPGLMTKLQGLLRRAPKML